MSKWAFLNDGKPERVVKAAVSHGRLISTGRAHLDAWEKMGEEYTRPTMADKTLKDGFITSRGRYINREEARKMATRTKQVEDDGYGINGRWAQDYNYDSKKGSFK